LKTVSTDFGERITEEITGFIQSQARAPSLTDIERLIADLAATSSVGSGIFRASVSSCGLTATSLRSNKPTIVGFGNLASGVFASSTSDAKTALSNQP